MLVVTTVWGGFHQIQAVLGWLFGCTQLDITIQDWVSEVQRLVMNWRSLYLRDIENHGVISETFEQDHLFPHAVFEFSSVTDGLPVEA